VVVDAGCLVDRHLEPERDLGCLTGVETEFLAVLDSVVEDVFRGLCRRLDADVFERRRDGDRLTLVDRSGRSTSTTLTCSSAAISTGAVAKSLSLVTRWTTAPTSSSVTVYSKVTGSDSPGSSETV